MTPSERTAFVVFLSAFLVVSAVLTLWINRLETQLNALPEVWDLPETEQERTAKKAEELRHRMDNHEDAAKFYRDDTTSRIYRLEAQVEDLYRKLERLDTVMSAEVVRRDPD